MPSVSLQTTPVHARCGFFFNSRRWFGCRWWLLDGYDISFSSFVLFFLSFALNNLPNNAIHTDGICQCHACLCASPSPSLPPHLVLSLGLFFCAVSCLFLFSFPPPPPSLPHLHTPRLHGKRVSLTEGRGSEMCPPPTTQTSIQVVQDGRMGRRVGFRGVQCSAKNGGEVLLLEMGHARSRTHIEYGSGLNPLLSRNIACLPACLRRLGISFVRGM